MEEAASRIGMSAATFYRRFQTIMGTSPRQYVKTLRLYEAKRLMNDEQINATEAARRVGYKSHTTSLPRVQKSLRVAADAT